VTDRKAQIDDLPLIALATIAAQTVRSLARTDKQCATYLLGKVKCNALFLTESNDEIPLRDHPETTSFRTEWRLTSQLASRDRRTFLEGWQRSYLCHFNFVIQTAQDAVHIVAGCAGEKLITITQLQL
jgi:hypothetical protein